MIVVLAVVISLVMTNFLSLQVYKMERKGTFKVNTLREIEQQVQEKWQTERVFESNAPSQASEYSK